MGSCALTLGTVSRSLEAISGLDGSGRIFTVLVQGLLQLQVRLGVWGAGPRAHRLWWALHALPVGGRALWAVTSTLGCLQAGQYASVFVDNGSGAALAIQSGSSFSGLLLGT